MSYPIAIARQNPKPRITQEEWKEFVRENLKLKLLDGENIRAMTIHVEEKRNKYIFETNGVISCDGLSVPIMREMFDCAEKLKAQVIGPKGYVFKNFTDWETRTHEKRKEYSERIAANKKKGRIRNLLFFSACCAVVLILILLNS